MAYSPEQISIMDSIIARYPRKRSAIMPLLHYVQSIDGYVTNEGIELIGQKLELATAQVTAVLHFILNINQSRWANIMLVSALILCAPSWVEMQFLNQLRNT